MCVGGQAHGCVVLAVTSNRDGIEWRVCGFVGFVIAMLTH
jgi:hypothetical protein